MSEPVYALISSYFRQKILNGSLTPDDSLPSENELCRQFSTTRETVRKGLKQLEQEGLIYSLPRKGYFVNFPKHHEITVSVPKDLDQTEIRYKDIKIIRPNAEIQEALRISPSQKVIAFYRGIFNDSVQVGLEEKFLPYGKGLPSIEDEINFAVFPEAADAKSASFHYYTQLNICACMIPNELCYMFDFEKEEPLLLIKRIFITQEGIRIGYSKQYWRAPYGELQGFSGYVKKNKSR